MKLSGMLTSEADEVSYRANSSSDDCSVVVSASSDRATASAQDHIDDHSGPSSLTFNNAIRQIMAVSYTKFSTVRPAGNDSYTTATVAVPYDGEQQSCSIDLETANSAELRCTLKIARTKDDAEKAFDTAKARLSEAASAWAEQYRPDCAIPITIWMTRHTWSAGTKSSRTTGNSVP